MSKPSPTTRERACAPRDMSPESRPRISSRSSSYVIESLSLINSLALGQRSSRFSFASLFAAPIPTPGPLFCQIRLI